MVGAGLAGLAPRNRSTSANWPFDKLKVLSFDDTLPLSPDWLATLPEQSRLWGRKPSQSPLLGRARIESKWFELVWDGLSAPGSTPG